ncbi:hypothetical protein [Dactylosporangium sp. NPDC005555]|uniref:hypothetical protein n=1 Tax=Dactylosporangium sp. NPDC005555 TaxID=3154889 RepID=UPI0033BF456F
MLFVRIPVGAPVPPVCPRHGRHVTKPREMAFLSALAPWMWPVAVLGGRLIYHFVLRALRREVVVPAWPWCGRCELRFVAPVVAGYATFFGSVAVAVYAVEQDPSTPGYSTIGIALLCAVVGLLVAASSSRTLVAGVRVSRDGLWLEVRRAHPSFLEALRSQPAPDYPMPAGFTVPATAAPFAVRAAPPVLDAPAAVDTPPVLDAPPPSHGWAPPSA